MIEYKAYRDSDGIWVPFFKNDKIMGTNGERMKELPEKIEKANQVMVTEEEYQKATKNLDIQPHNRWYLGSIHEKGGYLFTVISAEEVSLERLKEERLSMPVRIKEASPFYEYGPITHGICQEWFFKEDVC